MAGSLQDQLLKAGLSDKKKAKKLANEQRKQRQAAQKAGGAVVDEAKVAAQRAREEKAARDRELNQALNEAAQRKALEAQIVQLIENHKLSRNGGEVGFHFTFEQKVKKLYVTDLQQKLLAAGSIVIAQLADRFELIPAQVGSKIAERDARRVIVCAEATGDAGTPEERDWYKDYEVPDDLMW